MEHGTAVLMTLIAYNVTLVSIGLWSQRRTHDGVDYFLGGRRLGAWVVAISAKASDMSGWLLLGLPGQAFTGGVSIVWAAIGCTAGTFFNWTVLAGRLRRYSELLRAITVPDFLESRFGGQAPIRTKEMAPCPAIALCDGGRCGCSGLAVGLRIHIVLMVRLVRPGQAFYA